MVSFIKKKTFSKPTKPRSTTRRNANSVIYRIDLCYLPSSYRSDNDKTWALLLSLLLLLLLLLLYNDNFILIWRCLHFLKKPIYSE